MASRRFDVGSSSITTTDARRQTVGFTNGYDFGYFSLVVPTGSPITGFDKLAAGQRIGVVQGTVQEAYVVDTLHLEPVKFPDYNTVYASLKTRQIDAWVAPSQQAQGTVQPGDPAADHRKHLQLGQFRRVGGGQGEQAAHRRAELRAGRDHRRRHLVAAVLRLGAARIAARLEAGLEGGAGAAAARLRGDRRRATRRTRRRPRPQPKSTLSQLKDSFLDWDLYKQAIPDLFKTGLPNTLILTVSASVIGLVLGMVLAVAGISPCPLAALAGPGLHRHLPRPARGGDHPADRPRRRADRRRTDRQQPVSARHRGAGADGGGLRRRDLPLRHPERGGRPARGVAGAGLQLSVVDAAGGGAAGHSAGAARAGEPVHLAAEGLSLVYFLGLVASQRELFQVGRDLNAQTGNLSPLVAAGLFYLLLTIPLTHLVNYIDARLRRGRKPGRGRGSASPLNSPRPRR